MTIDTDGASSARDYAAPLVFDERSECPTCGARERVAVWTGRFDQEPTKTWILRHEYAGDPLGELGDATFELVRCRACAMLYHARVLGPEGLARLYGTWIDSRQIERFEARLDEATGSATRFELGRQTFKHMLRLHALAGAPWPFRILDFGCGDGHAVAMASAMGLEAWGVDPSVTREERATQRVGRIHPSIADAVRASTGPFDAILLMQVLEHLTSPRAVLEEIRGALRPGGVLLVEVPDARPLRAAPASFEELRIVHPLEHVNAFTPETLERICVGAGFKRVPRIPVHATAALSEVLRTALTRIIQLPSTSQYFVRTE